MAKRKRIEGRRRLEVLDKAATVLLECGYDRLTYDEVATRARASKATLYRHWPTKATLTVDALLQVRAHTDDPVPDTGTLRGDLIAHAARHQDQPATFSLLASLVSALSRDHDLARQFRGRVLPLAESELRLIFSPAQLRREIPEQVDVSLATSILPALFLHRQLLDGSRLDRQTIIEVIDRLVLPAAYLPGHDPSRA